MYNIDLYYRFNQKNFLFEKGNLFMSAMQKSKRENDKFMRTVAKIKYAQEAEMVKDAKKRDSMKRIEMNEKTAIEIAGHFFCIVYKLLCQLPQYFSGYDKCGEITVDCDKKKIHYASWRDADEENDTVYYRVIFEGRSYRMEFCDNEELYGYYSCLTNMDRSVYVFCSIREETNDNKRDKKCEMDFAFDIETGAFLELFAIEHFNKVGIVRECQNIDYIESKLREFQIFEVDEELKKLLQEMQE